MPSRLLVLPLLALAAAPTAAQAQWSPPERVATGAARAPQVAFGTRSAGVGSFGVGAAGTRIVSLPAAATRDVGSIEAGPRPYAASRTVSLRRRATGTPFTYELGYSFGRTDGAVGDVRPLRTVALRPNEAELAVSPGGNAVIAFAEERGGRTRVFVSVRRAGRSRFTTPRVVRGSGSARSLAVAVNDEGRWVLSYSIVAIGGPRVVEARIGTSDGRVGPLQRIGTHLGATSVAAVVAATGRTTVAWATHDTGIEQNDPTELRTNVVPAGRATFAGQTVLDRAAPNALSTEPSPPTLAAAPDGTAIVGYTLSGTFTADDARTPAKVAVQDREARWHAPVTLAEDGAVGQVAARADGTFAVPFATGVPLEGGPSPLFVALGRTAFTPELVAPDADEDSAVAFAPDGSASVLYTLAGNGGAALSRRGGS